MGNSLPVQQTVVTYENAVAVYSGQYTVTGDILVMGGRVRCHGLFVSSADGFGNRMAGIGFSMGSVAHHFLFSKAICSLNFGYSENAFG